MPAVPARNTDHETQLAQYQTFAGMTVSGTNALEKVAFFGGRQARYAF